MRHRCIVICTNAHAYAYESESQAGHLTPRPSSVFPPKHWKRRKIKYMLILGHVWESDFAFCASGRHKFFFFFIWSPLTFSTSLSFWFSPLCHSFKGLWLGAAEPWWSYVPDIWWQNHPLWRPQPSLSYVYQRSCLLRETAGFCDDSTRNISCPSHQKNRSVMPQKLHRHSRYY